MKSTLEVTSLHIDTTRGSFRQVIASLRMPSKFVISIYMVFSPCPDVLLDIAQLNPNYYLTNLIRNDVCFHHASIFWGFKNLNFLNFWRLSYFLFFGEQAQKDRAWNIRLSFQDALPCVSASGTIRAHQSQHIALPRATWIRISR